MPREISEYVQHAPVIEGAVDAHGNATQAWGDPVDVGIWAFDPGSSSEPRLPGQGRVIVEPTVFWPEGVVFGPDDQIIARGLLYEVEGETREWKHPNGEFSGNVATLRRVRG